MSVVVAIKENDRVYIGCDSQATQGGSRTTLKNPNNYKVWNVLPVNNCLMASVGNVRDACVIRTMTDLVSDYDVFKDCIDFDYVVNNIVPHIIYRLKEVKYLNDEPVFEGFESVFLFTYKDKLFHITNDGSVIEIEDFVAIGSGKNEAIGSLLSTDGLKPEERIIKAIKASAASDIYVDYPIIITNTVDQRFDIITQDNEESYIKYSNKLK